jgi:tetratricopeptide (TPR) repeat protein/DNA-binding XRE family transcriptional regulator
VTKTGGSRRRGAPVADEAPRPARRRLPGVNVRPGTVKQARQEAGLSLAQLGKGHVTAPAIFLIETGRTRPSLPTLEHIAQRTGKPVEFFLADPAGVTDEANDGLVELEVVLAEGRYADAIALGQKLMELGSAAHRLGKIRYFLAQAHLSLGKPEVAADLLRQAHAHFESVDDRLMLAECLGSEASIAYVTHKPDAQRLAERALSVLRELSQVPPTTEARLLAILATVHVANGDWDSAIRVYHEAIDAAGSLFDLRRLAKMYNGLSVAHREAGQVEAAARYASRSIALLEVLRDRVSLARAENELGLIMMAKGERSSARRHFDRALELSEETDVELVRSAILLNLCGLCLQEGNVPAALELAERALLVAERLDEAGNVAEAHMWLGRVADIMGDIETTDREFELALDGFSALDMNERLLQCHGTYAEILERRGDLETAYVHLKKALSASRPGLYDSDREAAAERASTA